MTMSVCPECGLSTSRLGPVYSTRTGVMALPGKRGVEVCDCPSEDEEQRERVARLTKEIEELPKDIHASDPDHPGILPRPAPRQPPG